MINIRLLNLYNIPDTIVKNNLFVNGSLVGTTPLDPTNMLNIDPQFINQVQTIQLQILILL